MCLNCFVAARIGLLWCTTLTSVTTFIQVVFWCPFYWFRSSYKYFHLIRCHPYHQTPLRYSLKICRLLLFCISTSLASEGSDICSKGECSQLAIQWGGGRGFRWQPGSGCKLWLFSSGYMSFCPYFSLANSFLSYAYPLPSLIPTLFYSVLADRGDILGLRTRFNSNCVRSLKLSENLNPDLTTERTNYFSNVLFYNVQAVAILKCYSSGVSNAFLTKAVYFTLKCYVNLVSFLDLHFPHVTFNASVKWRLIQCIFYTCNP